MTHLNIGVIGAGGRGYLSGHAHKPEQGVKITAAADIVPSALQKYKELYGSDVFTTDDYHKLLAKQDIDAVFITAPDYLHETIAVDALKAGKHVYLEKPMAITIDGCDRILKTAFECKKKLYLGHNMRHMPIIQKMKKLIDDGAIGQIKAAWCRHFVAYGGDAYFKDWHADRTKSTGLLLQKGAHDIDVLHWLCGGYTQKVTAMGGLTVYDQITDRHSLEERGDATWSHNNWPPLSLKGLNPVIDVEDISMMLMQLDNGVFASYQQCHYTPDGWRNYTFIGTEGRLENFGDYSGDSVIKLWDRRHHYQDHGDIEYRLSCDLEGHGGGDPNIVSEFIRYIREGGKVKTSPIAARMSVAAGCQATHSIRNGFMPTDIPPVAKEIVDYFNQDLEV